MLYKDTFHIQEQIQAGETYVKFTFATNFTSSFIFSNSK